MILVDARCQRCGHGPEYHGSNGYDTTCDTRRCHYEVGPYGSRVLCGCWFYERPTA